MNREGYFSGAHEFILKIIPNVFRLRFRFKKHFTSGKASAPGPACLPGPARHPVKLHHRLTEG